MLIGYGLINFFGVESAIAVIISALLSFLVFKIDYVHEEPFMSFLTLIFLMFLEALMLGRAIEFF